MRPPRTILVAPDSFKGTLSALEAARAIGKGLSDRDLAVDLCPVADGGEGTLEVLVGALGGEVRRVASSDPLGRPIVAPIGFCRIRHRLIGVVEGAAAAGLDLVDVAERDPVAATSYGVGELIAAAAAGGAEHLLLGLGGTATTDGGSGALRAIRDAGGLDGVGLTVLCDVRVPFEDAARVFAPQKGASPDQVRRLTARLRRQAGRLRRDPRKVALTGAAGGLAGGLWAELGAELRPGARFILDHLDFDRRTLAARAVVSGEGRLDRQSLAGKALSEVATRARQSGVPAYAIVGQRSLDDFGLRILDLQAVLEAGTPRRIRSAARRLAELI